MQTAAARKRASREAASGFFKS
ncbi:MAG: hypothetical protein ACREDC_14975 [Bradyrhizobium sp.]